MSIRPLWSTGAHYSPSSAASISCSLHGYHLFRVPPPLPPPLPKSPTACLTKNTASLSPVPFYHPPSQLFPHLSILRLPFLLTIKKYLYNFKWHLSVVWSKRRQEKEEFRGIFLLPSPFPSLLLSNFEKCVVDFFFFSPPPSHISSPLSD